MAEIKAPVLTSADAEQLEAFARFIAELRTNNVRIPAHVRIAEEESGRLGPYFDALGATLAADLKEADDENPELAALSKPRTLSKLFNQAARNNQTTILSTLVLAPADVLKNPDIQKGTTPFFAAMNYNGYSFKFGFIQVFEAGSVASKNIGSTSVPVLAFDPRMMEFIAPHLPAAMLAALQAVATASNHDMQHHYTSTILNPRIAETASDKKLPSPDFTVRDWSDLYFNHAMKDSDPKSYEAWLMFNHARVRRLMEEGPEGEVLKRACDTCFGELKRIGAEIAAEIPQQKPNVVAHKPMARAHAVVDYFGTMLLFAMSRSMPLDHPLMDHAIRGLQQADPDPQTIEKRKEEILARIDYPNDEEELAGKVVANYRATGVELMRKEHDYVSLKKLQLINIEPWVAHLMSPGQPGTELGEMQQRVGEVNREMLNASALTAWFGATDGLHTTKRPNGETMETCFKDGQLHRGDGPALVVKDAEGNITGEQWFLNGRRYRADGGPDFFEAAKKTEISEWHDEEGRLRHKLSTCPDSPYPPQAHREFWFDENGRPHREDGPALLIKDATDKVLEEEWKQHGVFHRDDGPAETKAEADGTRKQLWYRHGAQHNDSGPAYVATVADGTRIKEAWKKNGGLHREDGPASITIYNGIRTEAWYHHGLLHNENGPAYIRKAADGTVIEEEWYKNGQRIEAPVKQATAVKNPSMNR